MAQKRRSSQRRPQRRPSGPVYVAPVLDPTWQSTYSATSEERERRENALQRFARLRAGIGGLIALTGAVVCALFGPWIISLLILAVGVVHAVIVLRASASQRDGALDVAAKLITHFEVGGNAHERQRLTTIAERLAATFGLDAVTCMVVSDTTPNATLMLDRNGYTLMVTTGMMESAELIELEGVVAHCMARQRLGYLQLSAAAVRSTASSPVRRLFDGLCPDFAFRADEIAAASIRYPVGLAGALRVCATATVSPSSYFASEDFRSERLVWFDPYIDGRDVEDGDLNRAEVRAAALEEW